MAPMPGQLVFHLHKDAAQARQLSRRYFRYFRRRRDGVAGIVSRTGVESPLCYGRIALHELTLFFHRLPFPYFLGWRAGAARGNPWGSPRLLEY